MAADARRGWLRGDQVQYRAQRLPVEGFAVLMDYWLAGQIGRLWLMARPGLRDRLEEMPAACLALANSEPVPASVTWRAQEFALRVWGRFALVVVVPGFVVIGIAAALHPGQTGTDAGASILAGLVCLMTVGLAQMGLLRYRADKTRRYLRAAGAEGGGKPLPPDSLGRPTRFDFWVMLMIAMAVFGILLYAGTR